MSRERLARRPGPLAGCFPPAGVVRSLPVHHPKVLGVLLASAIAVSANAGATPAAVPYPRSMAALGDSLTLAYPNSVEESWATGGNPFVRSHYLRILAAGGGAIRRHAYNLAVPGASFL